MVSGAVDSVVGDSLAWGSELVPSAFIDELAGALASGQFSYMRSGFVPSGVNPDVAWGSHGWSTPIAAAGSEGGADGGGSVAPPAREHGTITPLQLGTPLTADGGDGDLLTTLDDSGGDDSGGSGGGSPPWASDDFYSGGHDEDIIESDNGVLWNDYLGEEPAVLSDWDYLGPGQLTVSTGGGFTYTPPSNWAGEDSFTYEISNSLGSSEATVTLDIVNWPPWANEDWYYMTHDTTLVISDAGSGLKSNDSDSDHDMSEVTLHVADGPYDGPYHAKSFSYDNDGTFSYEPDDDWVGTDMFTYTLDDGIDESNPVNVTIEVTNEAPMAEPDNYTAIVNTQLAIPSPRWPSVEGVIDNDSDPEDDEVTVSWHDQPGHGSVSVAADGSFVYMPQTDYVGDDSFEYRISDGFDESEEATVSVEVVLPLVDLDTDSDNRGVIEHSQLEDDDEMAAPGKILRYNADDDNANDVEDRLESPLTGPAGLVEDDDLYPVELAVGVMTPQMDGFTLEISHSATLKLWDDRSKSDATSLTYTIGTDTIPSTFFMEGFSTGTGQVQCVLRNDSGAVVNQDAVLATIVDVRLKGYTPQTIPFVPIVIADTRKGEHDVRIRRNGDDDDANTTADWQDTNVSGEDDLIQVDVHASPTFPSQVGYTLERSGDAVKVWSTASKGTCYLDSSGPVPIAGGDYTMWVEYNPARSNAESVMFGVWDKLHNQKAFDESLQFTPFNSTIIVFGGNTQVPLDHGCGTFVIAEDLYAEGYDVHAYDEEDVDAAAQAPYHEVVSAVDDRGVTEIAIIGYSQGGGAVHVLANGLATNPPTGAWTLEYTAYIDGVRHNGWNPETRLPSGSAYHVNYWQSHPSGILGLHGASNPGADFNLDVRTTAWGAALDHFTIDNHQNVIDRIQDGSTAGGVEGPHDGLRERVSR